MTSTSSSDHLLEAVLETNNHLQLGFTSEMRPVLCQLGCWVTREGADNATVIVRPKAAKSKDVPLCLSDPPCAPLPHFHEETSALIRGDFWVIYKLPRVKAKALKRARRSASRAVHLEQKDTSSPKSGGEFISRLTERSQRVQQRILLAREIPGRRARGNNEASLSPGAKRRSCSIMVQHEIHQTVTQASVGGTGANGGTSKPSTTKIGTAITASGRYPVYDGLRSSPPTAGTEPHTWKPYTGPSFDSPPPPEAKDLAQDPYEPEKPSPLLEYATQGRRAAATVVDHRSRPIPIPIRTSSRNQHSKPLQIQSPRVSTVPISPFPPLSPLPSPISTPTQSPPQTPINPNSNNPDSNSPSPNPIYSLAHLAGGRYHYTSPEAQTIFAAVIEHYNSADRARAQLAATPSLTPTGGSLLAFFLLGSGGLHDPLSRGEARRVFRASAPALADLVDEMVDWTGVEEEEDVSFWVEGLGEDEVVRRLWWRFVVEEFLGEGGGRLFGLDWETDYAVETVLDKGIERMRVRRAERRGEEGGRRRRKSVGCLVRK